MTPSNQHSDEAIAEYPDLEHPDVADLDSGLTNAEVLDFSRTAFDRGRESKQHTDRETVWVDGYHSRACGITTHYHGTSCHSNCPTCHGQPAPKPVAAPSLSLVAVRDEVARVILEAIRSRTTMDDRRLENYLTDALFLSSTVKPEAPVRFVGEHSGQLRRVWWADNWWDVAHVILNADSTPDRIASGVWVEFDPNDIGPRARAARVRSGKDET